MYSNLSKSKLEKLLRTEKTRIHSNAELIRFLSKLLRSKYKNNGIIPNVCHQSDFEKDFCKYCESNLDKKERPDPEFDEQSCYNYFKIKNKARNRNKLFCISP